MKKQKIALRISVLTLGLFFIISTYVSAEVIKSFDSKITVNTDASVTVIETIMYDSEGLEKHGIFRDITPFSSEGKRMQIKDISVVDPSGTPYQWQRQTNNGDVRLKIGDPDTTFQGEKTYVIHYKASNAVAYPNSTLDEIYWNVTGDKWPFPILRSEAQVVLPSGAGATQFACYRGVQGATDRCDIAQDAMNHFINPVVLAPGEGMTVVVGFPKGFIFEHVPTTKEKFLVLLAQFWPLLIPIITFIAMFSKWHKIGRDAKGRGIIIPEYEVIDSLTPLEASMIMNQKFFAKDLVAEILLLATRGYISINQTVKKEFIGKSVEYTLTLKKALDENLPSFDQRLLKEIFNPDDKGSLAVGTEVTLSKSFSLFSITNSLSAKIKEKLIGDGYYTQNFLAPSFYKRLFTKKNVYLFVLIAFLISFFAEFFVNAILARADSRLIVVPIISVIVSYFIIKIFNNLMPAKTQKGALAKEHLLGLREYIKVAEKDRIAFHNAPEMNAALFEKLLPYAVMFGLEKKWARSFEGIMIPPPSWYSSNGANFVPALFVADFSHNFSSSFFTAPSPGGGSSGGGFSGGGGGGGGGGSW